MPDKPIPWDKLSPGSRAVVLRVVTRLAGGMTGSLEIDCHDGNATLVKETERFAPKDLLDDKAA